ncbi:metabotropic glutamate receptor 5-like [Chrysoperla carnea]|uniref:metabotropic glutamate receptor 5-like n=1 Tax=Chrysoperla carnea TaxID=189513 RepID=UPI001D06ACBC|nr:metabotropic glutamate receptor 5-like [Chrysoperla carnea]
MCSLNKIILTFTISVVINNAHNSLINTNNNIEERGSALLPGDFIFGALYSIHHQPKQKRTAQSQDSGNILKCGEVREMYGIQRVEVTFQTLDIINKDPRILPNITLGVEIRDSCWYAPVALQQSIELIRDSISPNSAARGEGGLDTCPVNDNNPVIWVNGNPDSLDTNNEKRQVRPLIGVIGPGSSSVALQVQNLLQLFHIPQVGYSTTSKDLSDKSRFNYFLRVVPSDYYQAQVMVDVVKRFNWTYVSAVNTDENYGQAGIQAFRELAERSDVCIAKEDSVLSNADDEDFDDVIRNLVQDTSAQVVVCFCEGMTVRGLLQATKRLNYTGRLLFIGSDGWADRHDVTEHLELEAHGSISIRIHSPYVHSFDDYYFNLRPDTNLRNPWFKEFWQVKFSCRFPDDNNNPGTSTVYSLTEGESPKACTGEERLKERYKQDPKLSFVIKAIYTLAYGLHTMQQDLCGRNTVGLCPQLYPFNGSLFKSYLMNVSFTLEDGDVVEFDSRGDPPGRYDIMNFQLLEDGNYDYIQVGDWNNGTLGFTRDLQFGPDRGLRPPESVCSRPCDPGSYKNFQKGGQDKRCCWVCVPCRSNEILADETTCRKCPPGTWPNTNKTYCNHIPVEFVQWTDTQAIVAIVFSCIGFLTTAFGCIVFVRFNNTPVVKSSTRELSYLILAGMTLSHATTFPIISKPSDISCSLSRTLPGISFAMIYASLLTKTNRIARILAGSKKRFPTRKPRFMSGTSQVLITCFLISLEVGFAITMLIYEPADATFQYPALDRVILVCNTTPTGVLAPLAFDFFLIILCTVYALKTRNVPENFNEAKFIGFAMYTTCVIWVAFVPIYFGSETKIITMCVCVTLSAMVTFVFLFIPKMYIILLRPERNNRALFTTSKSIRCHIGSRVASAVSEKSSFSSSGFQESATSSHHHWRSGGDMENMTQTTTASSISSQIQHATQYSVSSTNSMAPPTGRREVGFGGGGIMTKPHVNWKDKQSNQMGKNEFDDQRKPEKRTLSCQTGNELIQFLIQAHLLSLKSSPPLLQQQQQSSSPTTMSIKQQQIDNTNNNEIQQIKWTELNARTLMDPEYTSIIRYRTNSNSTTPRLISRRAATRIREESASDASLSDNDSCQLKNITISLGSITSVHSHHNYSTQAKPSVTSNGKCLQENLTRSMTPISWTKTNLDSPPNSLV